MANAYSIQRNRQGWIDPQDQEFTLKALMFKQQKYDSNRAKVDAVVEQYKSLQLARGVDKDYLNERLNYIFDNINSGNNDFSSNAFTASINNYIGEALDNNVMTAIQETAKIKRYQEDVAKLKEKNPELYNPLNEAYGLAPAQEYLQNTEVGAKINGNLMYTPYKDIEGEVNKWLTDIQMKAKDGKIQIPDNQGRIQEITVNGKSAAELRDLALGYIGNRYDDQLKVNVWGNTGGFKNLQPQVESAISGYDAAIEAQNKAIIEAKTKLTGPLSDTEKDKLKDSIKAAENQLLQITQMKQSLQDNPVGALVFLEKQKIAGRSGAALGLLRTESVEYKADDYYFKTKEAALNEQKFQFEIAKEENNMAVKAQEFKYKEAELRLKEQEIGLKGAEGDGTSSNATGGGKASGGFYELDFTSEDIGDGPKESFKDLWKQDISSKYQDMNQFNSQTMNTVIQIAKGEVAASKERKDAAIALITEFRSKGGNLNTASPKQAQNFMMMLSRADAYSALNYLPVNGGAAINVKQAFQEKLSEYSSSANSFAQARKKAQDAINAQGGGKAYGDDLNFIEAAKSAVPFSMQKQLGLAVTSKNKAAVTMLINSSETARASETVPIIGEDSSMFVKDLKNGKYEVTFSAKSKDANKDAIHEKQKVVVSYENAHKIFPQLQVFQKPREKFTIESMGTKPKYSPSVRFANPNSEDYDNLLDDIKNHAVSPLDEQLVDVNSAKRVFSQTLGVAGERDPQVREQMNQLINQLLTDETMNKFKTGVHYGYSTTPGVGRGFVSLFKEDGTRAATLNMGLQKNLDKVVGMNQWAPQVIYSKIVLAELTKVMENYRTGSGKFELTPELQKILNG